MAGELSHTVSVGRVERGSRAPTLTGLRLGEEGLGASEEQFRSLVESIQDYAIIMLDREGRVMGWNPGAARMKGYSAEEIVGSHFSLFYPPELVEAGHPEHELELALAEGSYQEDGERMRKDGTRFWADVTITPVRDGTGELRGFAKVTRDITDRKQMVDQLERNRRQLIESQVIGGFGSWEWDVVANETRWSENLWRLYGLEPGDHPNGLDEVIRRTHPDDREMFRTTVQTAFENGEPFAFDQQILHADGSVRTLQCRGEVIAGDDGAPLRMLGSAQDITERRRAEQELRASEERFRLLAENSRDVIRLYDADRIIRYVSPSSLAVLGYAPDELVGRGASEFQNPDDIASREGREGSVLAADGEVMVSYRSRRKDGSYAWLESSARALRDESGAVVGFQEAARDISERKRAEEAARAAEERYRDLFENAATGIAQSTLDGRPVEVNQAWASLLGYDSPEQFNAEVENSAVLDMDPELRERLAGEVRENGSARGLEVQYRRRDGTPVWVAADVRLTRDASGEPTGLLSSGIDITARKQAEDQFRAAFGDAPIGMALVAPSGRFLRVNAAMCALVGYGESELLAKTFMDITDPDDQASSVEAVHQLVSGERQIFETEKRYVRRDGTSVCTFTSVRLVRHPAGDPAYVIAHVQDISERKHVEERLARRAEQRQALTRLTAIALRSHTLAALLSELVASVARILDVEACTVIELSPRQDSLSVIAAAGCADHIRASTPVLSASMWGHTLDRDRPVIVENYATETRFGAPAILADAGVLSSLSAMIVGREQPFGMLSAYGTLPRTFDEEQVAFLKDVASLISAAVERLRSEERSRYQARHDGLTGLANRALAEKNLELALARRRRYGGAVTVFLIDLDGFKIINDSLGHHVGDELLIALASRLRNAVRETDTVARFGGDEFVIVAEDRDRSRSSSRIADRLTAAIDQPIVLAASEHHLTAGIGIAVAPDNDTTPADLLRDADTAMYRAKSHGRGHRRLFDDQMRAEVTTRQRIETDLRTAIDNHELCVHYQPIIHAATGRPTAVEALVRWEHSERGFISPIEFIPIAEETGLILALGAIVMEIATRPVAAWQQQFGVPLGLCVNSSAREIADPGFSTRVAEAVRRSGLSPKTLNLEITERVLLQEADTPRGVLTKLRANGARLMLDDFGTGYSSMSTLQRFQLDTLKIDKSFVDRLGSGPEATAIVRAIIGLARGLQMRAVAEGVETTLQHDRLVELGCDYLQGYLLARPMPPDATESYLRETLTRPTAAQTTGSPANAVL